jgi:hypothetical protein
MKLHKEMSLSAQTAYAGLDEAARSADLTRSIASLPGGFARKAVAGRIYWYYQVKTGDGSLSQSYVGPDDDSTRALIARHGDPTGKLSHQHLVRLNKAAIELGCADIPLKHARVIRRFADGGMFSAGGILVGTHAFLAYQNLFGLRWEGGAATLDLDFAHAGRNVSLALPENLRMDTPAVIDSLEMGFIPNNSRTSYKKADEPDFDIDFLTSRGRTGDTPVLIPRFNLKLQPLRFMELSLQDPMRCTLLSRSGPVVVNLPRPERYALHKLLVFGERVQAQRVKAIKDLAQSAALVDYLLEYDAAALAQIWLDIQARGPGWRQRIAHGFKALETSYSSFHFEDRMLRLLAQ